MARVIVYEFMFLFILFATVFSSFARILWCSELTGYRGKHFVVIFFPKIYTISVPQLYNTRTHYWGKIVQGHLSLWPAMIIVPGRNTVFILLFFFYTPWHTFRQRHVFLRGPRYPRLNAAFRAKPNRRYRPLVSGAHNNIRTCINHWN